MKPMARSVLFLAVASLRCGQPPASTEGNSAPVAPDIEAGARPPAGTPAWSELRIVGVDAGDLRAVRLALASVTAQVDGVSVAVVPGPGGLDLLADGPALLARLPRPSPAAVVRVTIALSGGTYEGAAASGMIDARGAPIDLDFPGAWFASGAPLVVRVDLERSLIQVAPRVRAFLPAVAVAAPR